MYTYRICLYILFYPFYLYNSSLSWLYKKKKKLEYEDSKSDTQDAAVQMQNRSFSCSTIIYLKAHKKL